MVPEAYLTEEKKRKKKEGKVIITINA